MKMNWLIYVLVTFSMTVFSQSSEEHLCVFVDRSTDFTVNYHEFINNNFKLPNTKDSLCKLMGWRFKVTFYLDVDDCLLSTEITNRSKDICTCELYQKEIFDEIKRVINEYNKVNVWRSKPVVGKPKKSLISFTISRN